MIKLFTVKVEGDNPEPITFNIILGSNAPPILGTQYTSPQTKTYTTSGVTNKEYIKNIHIKHGHIQTKQLTEMLTEEGKWQPSFRNIIENVIGNCTVCLPKRVRSTAKPGTLTQQHTQDMGQEGTFTLHEETLITEKGKSESEKATQGRRKPGGTKDDDVGTHVHPFWTNF